MLHMSVHSGKQGDRDVLVGMVGAVDESITAESDGGC